MPPPALRFNHSRSTEPRRGEAPGIAVTDALGAWLIATAGIALVTAITRDRHTAPWAAGCAAAAGLEALHVHPGWQWGALLLVSSVVFVAVNRVRRYAGRHSKHRAAG